MIIDVINPGTKLYHLLFFKIVIKESSVFRIFFLRVKLKRLRFLNVN